MKTVVITGSSKGIGLGLAQEFLRRECKVVLSSFDEIELAKAADNCSAEFGSELVLAQVCDVTKYDEMSQLWTAAREKFGDIHIWINNAGVTSHTGVLWEMAPQEMETVIKTNLLGTMYGVRVAMHGMLEQGSGAIYNFYGHGSWDEKKPAGFATYGITKRAIRYFTECMIEECQDLPVSIGWLMPGVVLTDLIFQLLKTMPESEREMMKKKINIVGDTVETVAPWLADQVLRNTKHGAEINYMTPERLEQRKKDPFYLNRNLFEGIEI